MRAGVDEHEDTEGKLIHRPNGTDDHLHIVHDFLVVWGEGCAYCKMLEVAVIRNISMVVIQNGNYASGLCGVPLTPLIPFLISFIGDSYEPTNLGGSPS